MLSEKAKISNYRYKKAKREQVRLDVPKGTLAKYKAYAERRGMSMTALMTMLMEREMQEDGFAREWAAKEKAEQERIEREESERLSEIRSSNKPPEIV